MIYIRPDTDRPDKRHAAPSRACDTPIEHPQALSYHKETATLMETINHILFESPFLLAAVSFLLLLIAAGIWLRLRTTGALKILCGTLATIVILFVIQGVVVTDREQLRAITRSLANHVERGDVQRIVQSIAPDATFDGGRSRSDFESHLINLLKKYSVQNPSVSGYQIEVNDDRAQLTCRTLCDVRTMQWTYRVPARWRLDFQRIDQQWLLANLSPIEIAGQKYTSFWTIH